MTSDQDISHGQRGYAAGQPSTTAETERTLYQLHAELNKLKWLAPLLGTISVIILFWRIRYLPGLNISDIGLVAFAVVLFSMIMLAVVASVLLLPALAIQPWLAASSSSETPGKQSRTGRIPAGFPPAMIVACGGTLSCLLLHFAFFSKCGSDHPLIALTLFLTGSLVSFFTLLHEHRTSSEGTSPPWYQATLYRILAIASIYLFFIPVIIWVALGTHEAAKHLTPIELVIPCAIVISVHYALAMTHHAPMRTRLIVAITATGFLLLIAGTAFEAVDRAAKVFRLGMIPNQSVVVGKDECRIARAAGIVSQCTKLEGPGQDLYELRKLVLLNRLGDHMVLAAPEWTALDPTNVVVLPSDKVLAWYTTREQTNPSPAPKGESAPDVAPRREPEVPKPQPKRPGPKRAKSAPSC